MNQNKYEMLNFQRNLNLMFHLGTFDSMEKNLLVRDARAGFLSNEARSMMENKLEEQPENGFLMQIMDYFRKETEKVC